MGETLFPLSHLFLKTITTIGGYPLDTLCKAEGDWSLSLWLLAPSRTPYGIPMEMYPEATLGFCSALSSGVGCLFCKLGL